jgi:methionine-S-sulfoxide reductase
MKTIILAGGCFWGVEAYYQQIDGVVETEVGYADGPFKNPSYEQVCTASGHVEAVKLTYDETVVEFETLVDHFFNIVDPTAVNRQGNDIGSQYRTGFYNLDDEDEATLRSIFALKASEYSKPLAIEIKSGVHYDTAEAYHQNYLQKNPNGYCHINLASVKDV